MRVVYGVQFQINPLQEYQSSDECLQAVECEIVGWITAWYKKWKKLDINIDLNGDHITTFEDHEVRVTKQYGDSDNELCNYLWTYPSQPNENLLWQSQILCAKLANIIEISVIVRLSSHKFQFSHQRFRLRPPNIVNILIDKFKPVLGGREIINKPIYYSAGDVDSLLIEDLQTPNRVLPIVVLTPYGRDDVFPIRPEVVAKTLAGIAEVHILKSKFAGYKMRDSLTKPYSCFNGASRIYYPGFQPGCNPFDHPLYLHKNAKGKGYSGNQMEKMLFETLSSKSAIHIVEGGITKRVKKAIDDKIQSDRYRLVEELKAGKTDNDRLNQQLIDAITKMDQLQKDLELANQIVESQHQQLEETDKRFHEYTRLMAEQYSSKEAHEELYDEEDIPEINNVQDAIELAKEKFGNDMIILRSAEKSCTDSNYRKPEEVFQTLEAIHDVVERDTEAKSVGESIGDWSEIFKKDYGVKYTPHESEITMGKFGDERTFAHKGKKIQMTKHITLGGGSREHCVQIFFEIDEETGKPIIGYCGKHLSYMKMRT